MRRVWLVLVLGSLSAFGPLSIDMYLPALPQLSDDFHVGASTAQLTLTACLAGLALGQLVAGPLSDRFGRRAPLLAGLALFVVSSLLCAAAPSAAALIGLRFVQGIGGAAGIAISRAIARDLYGGDALARFFSTLMLVNGLAPILAPVVGAQILRVTSWRGVFVALAGIGAVLAVAAAVGLRETLPPALRREGGFASVRATVAELVSDRSFVGYLVVLGFSFGAMFAYIAGSSFVVETIHHGSPQLFAAIFAVNGIGIVAAGQVNGFLLGRTSARRLLDGRRDRVGERRLRAAGGRRRGDRARGDRAGVLRARREPRLHPPNATALALADHPAVAGSASGLIGVFQYAVGAAAAPLVGVGGTDSAYAMAIVIATLGGASLVAPATRAKRPLKRASPREPEGPQGLGRQESLTPCGSARQAQTARPRSAPRGQTPGRVRKGAWPREESNLRAQIRSLPLYPLSYGAVPARPGGVSVARPLRGDGDAVLPLQVREVRLRVDRRADGSSQRLLRRVLAPARVHVLAEPVAERRRTRRARPAPRDPARPRPSSPRAART